MKLSDLRPCDCCGGPLKSQMAGSWYVVRVTQAIVSPRAVSQVVGLMHIFGGALRIAEAMAPDADDAVVIMGDKEPQLMTELMICHDCAMQDHSIAVLLERRNQAISKAEREKAEGKTP